MRDGLGLKVWGSLLNQCIYSKNSISLTFIWKFVFLLNLSVYFLEGKITKYHAHLHQILTLVIRGGMMDFAATIALSGTKVQ